MATPYQYPQYAPPQPYQQSQQNQLGQQHQYAQQYQQSYGNGIGGYQQQQQYPSQQSPQPQHSLQHFQQLYPPQQYAQQKYPQQQYAQQQYSQTQYPNQQHAAAGYPTQQYRAPHQSGYQHAQATYGQTVAQTPSQSCFNCGTLGHFAQDCPEPKRQVPAGALNPEQHRRQGIAPPKRGGQIVTKFGPHGSSSQGSPASCTPAYSSAGYPQYPQSYAQNCTPTYTPNTPQSAPSSAQSWPPQQQYAPQYQQHQQPQSNGYYQAPPTPQQSWPTPSTPASTAPFEISQASQTPPSHSQYGFPTQTPQSQYGQIQATPIQGAHHAPTTSQQPGQSLESALDDTEALQWRQADDNKSAAADPEASPHSSHEVAAENEEVEGDDLNLLDIPDLPPSTALYGGAVVPLVGMPIPANFVVADALFPMDPPPPEAEGRCQSKYARTFQPDALSENIRESSYWKDHKEDVIFTMIAAEGDFVLLDECTSKMKARQRPQEEILRESRSESRNTAPPRKDAAEAAKSLDQLQKALDQARTDIANREKRLKEKKGLHSPAQAQPSIKDDESLVKAEPMSPPQSATIEHGSGYHDDSEDLLASLGVTGAAKPIGPPTRLVSQNSSTHSEAKSRSGSASWADNTDQYSNAPFPKYQQPNPSSNAYSDYSQNLQHHALPPPPPPAFYQQPYSQPPYADGGHSSPPTSGANPFGCRRNSTENGYGTYQYQSDNQPPHSSQMRSESSGIRKRGYDERSSSEESEEAARRQEDDITPKLKRRQPKVAAAYSRRW